MVKMAVQILGFFLGMLGFVGTIVCIVLPHWRSTAYVGSDITAMSYMKGLWMECVWNSTGTFQCKVYRSVPLNLQVARVLMVLSCVMSVVAGLVSVLGMKCTRFYSRTETKSYLALSGGVCFTLAGALVIFSAFFASLQVRDLQTDDHFLPAGFKYGPGQCQYIAMAASLVSALGGLVNAWSSSVGRGFRRPEIHTQRSQPVSPPPAFNNIYQAGFF